MASSPVIVFQSLGQQPAASVVEEIKKQDGLQRVFFGSKMEDVNRGILCTEWSSREAALNYRSSGLASSLAAKEEPLAFIAPGWGTVFEQPCTEVFTGFGALEGFAGNVGRFVQKMKENPPEGYRGVAFGESVGLEGEEKAVRMVIGWTSREAHLEAKEKPGAIQDNIHELRTLRKAVDLYHVEFKEL
ncbi:hypothetical protein C8A03DRAFT_11478 [Achaetomium macrosporum]|uniref:ABM domain-containing protein n=1 Tax=Achaetomium macrosporum TaxID=79813 RepID=A0AAN7HJB5_9PEZI|nr:hypothetical protein C8A03DRAFT_11478 [Achaetomium macrosporum]